MLFATSLQFIHPITQKEIAIKYDPRQEDAALDVFCDYHGFSF
jgi:hypothetical protein